MTRAEECATRDRPGWSCEIAVPIWARVALLAGRPFLTTKTWQWAEMSGDQVSVIICSHNPREDYLDRVIAGLKAQSLVRRKWELLIVDNASSAPLSDGWDLSWHPVARHVREERLGLTWARLAGIDIAAGDVLIFLDDDNVASGDYLEKAVDLFQRDSLLGVAGAGQLEPEFEEPPENTLSEYLRFLAIRSVSTDVLKGDAASGPVPWGAGLCVRAAVARAYAKEVRACPIRKHLDRRGGSLISGGDDEFSWVAQSLELKHGIFRELRVRHLIDRKRVQAEYLERLIQGNGYSCAMLAALHGVAGRNPFEVPSMSDPVRALTRLRVSPAIRELVRLIRYWRKTPLDRRFSRARSQGWEKGMADYARIVNDLPERGLS